MLWIISWKNIWRNKTRSLIVMFALIFGLFGGLFSAAIYLGMGNQRILLAIANETANIQIHHNDFLLNREIDDTISSVNNIKNVLDTLSGISGYSCRTKIVGMASSASTGTGVIINGILPDYEMRTTSLHQCIQDSMGSWFGTDKSNFVVIGEKLANKLNVKLRSKIELTFQDTEGNIARAIFRIGGIYKTGNTSFDEINIYIRYSELISLAGFKTSGGIHEIAIALQDDKKKDKVIQVLKTVAVGESILNWKELLPDLGMINDFMNITIYIMLTIILLALSFGIINTMLMAVLERTREIGMLLSLGMSKSKIFRMILIETILLTFTGALIGMIVSAVIIKQFGISGIDLSSMGRGLEDMGFASIIYPYLELDYYFGLTALVILTGIFSSVMPALKAIRMNPVDAIRSV